MKNKKPKWRIPIDAKAFGHQQDLSQFLYNSDNLSPKTNLAIFLHLKETV